MFMEEETHYVYQRKTAVHWKYVCNNQTQSCGHKQKIYEFEVRINIDSYNLRKVLVDAHRGVCMLLWLGRC